MSLRRQPPSVELKNGNPDVRVEKLNASKSNHYTWIVEITNLLQSKGLWEGVTVNVDPFMISSAAAIMSEANAPQEEQDSTALIQALASGDFAISQAALDEAAEAGPTQRTTSAIKRERPSTIKRRIIPLPSTPLFSRSRYGPVGAARDPARFQGLFHRREDDGSEDELEPEAEEMEKAKHEFLKKNASALHIIRSIETKSMLRRPHGAGGRREEAAAYPSKVLRELHKRHSFVNCENESN